MMSWKMPRSSILALPRNAIVPMSKAIKKGPLIAVPKSRASSLTNVTIASRYEQLQNLPVDEAWKQIPPPFVNARPVVRGYTPLPIPSPDIVPLKQRQALQEGWEVDVIDFKGKPVGQTVFLDRQVFGAPLRADIVHRVIVWQLAKRRQGTHKAKSLSEVRGSTKKPYKQKGTGNARAGTKRAPQRWKGGRAHPPRPRSYDYTLPKSIRRYGLRVALSVKLAQGKIFILDSAHLESPKTKILNKILEERNWNSVLLIDGAKVDRNFELASMNLKSIDVLPQQGANVYSIMCRDYLILTRESVLFLNEKLKEL